MGEGTGENLPPWKVKCKKTSPPLAYILVLVVFIISVGSCFLPFSAFFPVIFTVLV